MLNPRAPRAACIIALLKLVGVLWSRHTLPQYAPGPVGREVARGGYPDTQA